jgi:putative DNA methylase
MRRAIEDRFPFEELNRVAALESWRKEVHRPIYHVHKWWATRLGSVFRAILLGGLLDEGQDPWAHYYSLHDFRDRVVLDPFMGSGTTLGEALKLGCRVIGSDVNPVSYFQVREALRPVAPARLKCGFEALRDRVVPLLRPFYSSEWAGQAAELMYTFWVKIIRCPGCGGTSRLFSNWVFSTNADPGRKPAARCLCPTCGSILSVGHKDARAACPNCRTSFNPQEGPARRTTFVCEHCRQEHQIAETYRLTKEPPDHQMYALMLLLPNGEKVYKQPTDADRAIYAAACAKLRQSSLRLPTEEVPPGVNTNQARGYNYLRWQQMFNGRQLYALGVLLREVLREPREDVRRQFLLLFSGTLEFNSLFCSFKGEGTGAVRHLFNHHILKPERAPLENNPWGTSKNSGSFSTLFERRLLAARDYAAHPFEVRANRQGRKDTAEKIYGVSRPVGPRLTRRPEEVLAGQADAFVQCGDSSKLPLPAESIDLVVTDPPYFDNVHYSELADFFHVWLRIGLEGSEPAFVPATTRNEREVQGTSAQEFGDMLAGVFKECVRVLKPGGLLVFTFHHSRDEAWLAVAAALRSAGLRVVATHPIRAELSVATPKSQAKEPINLDCVIVCRRAEQRTNGLAAATGPQSPERAARLVRRFNESGLYLSRGDVRVILMGEFLKVASADNQTSSLEGFTKAIPALHGSQDVATPSTGAPSAPVQKLLF